MKNATDLLARGAVILERRPTQMSMAPGRTGR